MKNIVIGLLFCVILSSCEDGNAMKRFQPTDILVGTKVQHKSGGPIMVVIEEVRGRVRCRWLDYNGDSHSEWFNASELEKR